MIVYKVVRKIGDRYFSAEATAYQLEYFTDKVVTPLIPDSLIFVFEDIKRAIDQYDIGAIYVRDYELWECETESVPVDIFDIGSLYLSAWEAKLFWSKQGVFSKYTAPVGTRGVKDLRLIKKIDM